MCQKTNSLALRLRKKWGKNQKLGRVDYFDLWFDVLHFYVLSNQPSRSITELARVFLGLSSCVTPTPPTEEDRKGVFAYAKIGFDLVVKNETSVVSDCCTRVHLSVHPDLCCFSNSNEVVAWYYFLLDYRKALRKQKSAPASESDSVQFSFQFEEDEK